MPPSREKSVVLVSGGLDSAVTLKHTVDAGAAVLGLFFDYGQRALRKERTAARTMCKDLGADFRVVGLHWLREIAPAAVVKKGAPLPTVYSGDLSQSSCMRQSARAVWVPNRNACMVSIGASFAEALGCNAVVAGFNREEGASFPDNGREFVLAMNKTLQISTGGKVALECPLIDMDKTRIVKYGIEIEARLDRVWSCYRGGAKFCWRCESCARLERALRRNKRLGWFKGVNKNAL
ncbi:MAG: 7-cyano-7-deazaguanine synthase QueC [Planctomycetota bacterium]|nr:MAG: 7-cyano-7-deazaguanine synthase QueC [Planctomycetota bacterium]